MYNYIEYGVGYIIYRNCNFKDVLFVLATESGKRL